MDKRQKLLALVLCALAFLGACGGGDDGSEDASGGELSAQTQEIQSCVADAGFAIEPNDTKNFGVEVDYERLTVDLQSEGFDKPYNADIYIFEDAAAMQENRAAITLNTEDDLRNFSADNVLLNFSIVPDEEHSTALTDCIGA